MKITILCVGKLKEKFMRDAVNEYSKRLSRYVKLDVAEVADEKTPDHAGALLQNQKEGERLLRHIKGEDHVIALAITGDQYDSVAFSRKLDGFGMSGKGHVVFVIGGSLGLSEQVLGRADEELSFSKMTFPHQLMRVILLEQIYRGYRISRGEPYHK